MKKAYLTKSTWDKVYFYLMLTFIMRRRFMLKKEIIILWISHLWSKSFWWSGELFCCYNPAVTPAVQLVYIVIVMCVFPGYFSLGAYDTFEVNIHVLWQQALMVMCQVLVKSKSASVRMLGIMDCSPLTLSMFWCEFVVWWRMWKWISK